MRVRLLLIAIAVARTNAVAQATRPPYRDSTLAVDARVHDLIGRMSLEDKFWQLFMIPGDLDDSANEYSHGVFGLQISTKMDSGQVARAHA